MRKLTFCFLLLPFIVSAAPLSKEKLKEKYKKDCIAKITKGVKDAKKIAQMKEYCDCSSGKMVDAFSEKELEAIDKNNATPEQTAKVRALTRPCAEAVRGKIAK